MNTAGIGMKDMMTFETRERGWKDPRVRMAGEAAQPLDNKALAALVLEAVRMVDDGELNPPVSPNSTPACQPRAMLTLLTYCYAIGVYGSQDVEEMMYADASFRAMFGMEYPDWRQLRSFRRWNSDILRRTLEETFKGIWRLQGPDAADADRADNRNGEDLRRQAGVSLPKTFDLESLSDEVQSRLERAMFIDHMAMD